jgi:hypothetical protein
MAAPADKPPQFAVALYKTLPCRQAAEIALLHIAFTGDTSMKESET